MGKPDAGQTASSARSGGEPGELKHLSTRRKREDSASSGERKRRSPNRCAAARRGWRTHGKSWQQKAKGLGKPAGEGESPVAGRLAWRVRILSITGHANPVRSGADHCPRLNTRDDR